ncbi:MAG: type II secretion system minor pseudopilin GspJ [Gammaproteobacteria bacterium]|nr:type II secretion system minor pseudopilin GspJ [Gammaproteobacteria bacterium]
MTLEIKKLSSSGGFTLLEMLVALAIFALIAAISYSGLNAVTRQREQNLTVMNRLRDVQKTVNIISRDIMQTSPRAVREAIQGETIPALQAGSFDYALELTRGGLRNPIGQTRPSLQRVAYRIENGELVRLVWQVLDRAQDSEPYKMVLLADIERVAVRFLDVEGQWHEQWPRVSLSEENDPNELPVAVEIGLDLEDLGRINRLLEIAG